MCHWSLGRKYKRGKSWKIIQRNYQKTPKFGKKHKNTDVRRWTNLKEIKLKKLHKTYHYKILKSKNKGKSWVQWQKWQFHLQGTNDGGLLIRHLRGLEGSGTFFNSWKKKKKQLSTHSPVPSETVLQEWRKIKQYHII